MEFLPDSGQDDSQAGETKTRRSRHNHSPTFKAKVALAAIKGEKTLFQLAQSLRALALLRLQTQDKATRGYGMVSGTPPAWSKATRIRVTL